MVNRSWFLSNVNETNETDLLLTEILNYFYNFSLKFTKKDTFKNIEDLEINLLTNNSLYIDFNNWFLEEGKTILVKLSKIYFEKDDLNLVDDFNYFIFILKCVYESIEDYKEESFLILIDIIYSLEIITY